MQVSYIKAIGRVDGHVYGVRVRGHDRVHDCQLLVASKSRLCSVEHFCGEFIYFFLKNEFVLDF